MIGQTLHNRYTLTAHLGSGAMGTVYRATDSQTGDEVAVKVLNRELAFSPELLERFRREGEALRQLRHPNIVGFVDAFQHDPDPSGGAGGQQVIVMEYVAGGSLHSLIKQGPLPADHARKIALGLCDALTRAHDLGIIHRDIKPENILVAADGTPKLTDFGIARLLTEGTRITHSGVQVGTPYYMSPEAWEGKPLDAQADVWSLGIVLFEMLAGEVPFPGDTVIAVMHKVLTAPLPELKQTRPDAPEGLAQIVRRMMTRDKAARYQTMRQVAADLERGFPTAMPAPVAAKPAKPMRSTALWIVAAVGALAILALATWAAIFSTKAGSARPTTATSVTAQASAEQKATDTVVVPAQTSQSESLTATPAPTAMETSTAPVHWERLADGASFLSVALNVLAVSPVDPNTIFAGTYGAGLYISHDGGQTWAPSNDGLGQGTVGSIAFDPKNSNILYAALFDQGGVYKSADGGRTWAAVNQGIDLDGAWNWTGLVYADPTNSDRLYYTGTTNGFYSSTNAGVAWTRQSDQCPPITSLAIDPADGEHLYAGAYQHPNSSCLAGVYESTDGGRAWKRLTTSEMIRSSDQWGGDWWHVAADPRGFATIYAGGQNATFKSTDGGQTWAQILGEGCNWLAVNPDDGAVYCGQSGQLQISFDGGATWSWSGFGSQLGGSERFPFAIVPGTDTLYIGSDAVMVSADGGSTWNGIRWLGTARMRLTIDPRDGNRLFLSAIDTPGQIFRSEDAGKTWQISLTDIEAGGRVTIDPAQGIVYYPTGFGNALYRSKDDGLTWEPFGSSQPTHAPWQLVPDPKATGKLWLVGECGTRLAVSLDNGENFTEIQNFPDDLCQPILLSDGEGQRMYIVSWGMFHRSDDSGVTWRSIGRVNGIYRSAALDPSDSNVVYLGSRRKGVLKTSSGGQLWSQVNTGLTNLSINDLAIDSQNSQIIYAATDGGAFVSVDGGGEWSSLQEGLGANPIVYSIAVDSNDSSKVYAATPDGIFRLVGTELLTDVTPLRAQWDNLNIWDISTLP